MAQTVTRARARAAAERELARRKLSHFVRLLWPVVEPNTILKDSWYIDAVCDHLQGVTDGFITRLLINIPPRHLKSTIASVMWPAWEWLRNPSLRYLTSSYRLDLAIRDAVRSRRIMQSTIYQAMAKDMMGMPMFEFAGDQNVKSRYENDKAGWRISTSVGAGGTGEGGNRVTVDDPHSVTDVEGDDVRKAVHTWWDVEIFTRLNDPKADALVAIGQRSHDDDLFGHLLERGGYEHLCLPTMFECDHPHRKTTVIGFTDPRDTEGELLCPDRFGPAEVEDAKASLGSIGFINQHQQRPTPGTGTIFKFAWFKRWKSLPTHFDTLLLSADLAFKGKGDKDERAKVKDPSFVVFDLWGFVKADAYLIDQVRGQWDFKQSVKEFVSFAIKWPRATRKIIEAKANGPALISVLNESIAGLSEVEPQGSKIQRAMAVQPFAESGHIYIPDESVAEWVPDWLDEVCTFPFKKHNDRVDTMTQAIIFTNVHDRMSAMRRTEALSKIADMTFGWGAENG